jgi:hypothetical protein
MRRFRMFIVVWLLAGTLAGSVALANVGGPVG